VPWEIFWSSQRWNGKVGLLDDTRDGLSMPMQRDAMKAGIRPDLNTEDPAIIEKAGEDLSQLTRICDIKVAITDYQTLPEAKTWLHHSWSGDIVGAALYYMPKGVKPDVLSFWGPKENGVFQNDLMFITKACTKPALAHAFLNMLMDEKNAYDNFVQFVGYTPPQNNIDAQTLVKRGLIPKSISQAVLTPDQFTQNQELLALSPQGLTLWENAWSKFKAG
jgi:spermidine/putrescine transport system substrate-binding protein